MLFDICWTVGFNVSIEAVHRKIGFAFLFALPFSPAMPFRPGRADRVLKQKNSRCQEFFCFKKRILIYAPTKRRMMFRADPALNHSICWAL